MGSFAVPLPLSAFAALLALCSNPLEATAQTENEVDWPGIARSDLGAIRDTLAANAAFTATDRDSDAMRAWLETGFAQAEKRISLVRNERDYSMILAAFVNGFRDPHIGLVPGGAKALERPLSWPGIATRWHGGRYEVAYVATQLSASAPPLGAILNSCDGRSADALARTGPSAWLGDVSDPWNRFRSAPFLLWAWEDTDRMRPVECTFTVGHVRRRWRLRWMDPEPAAILSARSAGSFAPRAPFGLARWGPNAWWIGIPDMTSTEEWGSLDRSISATLPQLRSAQLVVIDLRGNRGGSSAYGDRLIRKLWGEELATAYQVSEGRVAYRLGPLVRQWIAAHDPDRLEGFDRAAKTGARSITVDPPAPAAASRRLPNPVKGRVLVLTDHACASSCLIFLQQLLRLPNLEQAGTESASDTIFGELTQARLPSGRNSLLFPVKAWIERSRRSHQYFSPGPRLTWRGDLRDVSGLYGWLWRSSRPSTRRTAQIP
jgi:hypothetical protein